MIKCSYAHGPADAEQLNRGRFTLYQPAQAVSPASWDDFVAGVRSVALEVVSDTIKFKDAVGRKFLFPWNLVNTREVSRVSFPTLCQIIHAVPLTGIEPLVHSAWKTWSNSSSATWKSSGLGSNKVVMTY